MTTASRLSLAALLVAAGAFCAGCDEAGAVVTMGAPAPAAAQASAQPHPCRTAGSMSTQKACRPMASAVGSR